MRNRGWRKRGGRTGGFSLVEIMIAMAVMMLALLALMSSIFSSSRLVDNSRERALAYGAARSKIEEMRNFTTCGSFANLFAFYSQAANKTTKVDGLNGLSVAGVVQPALEVLFPTDNAGNLSENPANAALATALGMPKDLNRNGVSTDSGAALNTSYKVIPVLVRVTWQGIGGKATSLEIATYITEK